MKIYLLWEPFSPATPPQLRGIWTDYEALRRHVRDRLWAIPPGGAVPYVETWERVEGGQLVRIGSVPSRVTQTVALDPADASGESGEETIDAQQAT